MNSARSSANASESPGSASVATVPGSHVCTDHGSGYPSPGSPRATGSGVRNLVHPATSAAALASACSSPRTASASPALSGNRAA